MRVNAYPILGALPIADIEPRQVLDAVRAVEGRGALHIARRTNQAIGAIFRFAVASGYAKGNPAADLRGALKVLPRVRHRASLKPTEVGGFLDRVRRYDGEEVTRLTLELVLRTMVRTSEVRFATWDEIERDLWRIPAERMKEWGLEHLVPITPQVRALLDRLKVLAGDSQWVCPVDGKPGSENWLLYACYRLGYRGRLTVHGMRGTASTVMNESGLFHEDWIERQLAHFPRDEVRAAYNSAEYWPHRVRMMEWWNDWLDTQATIAELM